MHLLSALSWPHVSTPITPMSITVSVIKATLEMELFAQVSFSAPVFLNSCGISIISELF